MRQIVKNEPQIFTDFIRQESPNIWDDIAPIREGLRDHMLENEQSNQCAYTEIRIDHTNSQSHIDHYKKQSLFPQLRFTYSNLFTACKAEEFGAKQKDKTVRVQSDYDNLLSPLSFNFAAHFTYDIATGEIESNTIQGIYTKNVFNLNHKILTERRKTAALQAIAYKDQFPVEETIEYIGEFESLIRYIYNVNNN